MALILINPEVIERIALDRLIAQLSVRVLMKHEDDPAPADGPVPFVRVHAPVFQSRRGRPDDVDIRRVMIRVMAHSPADDLRTDGWALDGVVHAVQAAMVGQRLSSGTHHLHIDTADPRHDPTPDEALTMRTASIDLLGVATRTTGSD